MVLGGVDDGAFDVAKQRVIVGDERQINFDTLVHRRIGKAFGDAVAVGLVGKLFANRWQVVLTVGILHVCQYLSPFVRQMHAAAKQVTGGAHLSCIDVRLREHTAPSKAAIFCESILSFFALPPSMAFM